MKRLIPGLFVFLLVLRLDGLGAVESTGADPTGAPAVTRVDDPGRLLPQDPPAARAIDAKLAAFARASGVKIFVRIHVKSPSADEDKLPGAYMKALATKVGTVRNGVLAVYFADEDDWRVWIGDDLTGLFVGRAGTAKELTESGSIHDVKEAMLTAARTKSDAAFAEEKKSSPPDRPPTAARRVMLQTDALVDALIAKFGPK